MRCARDARCDELDARQRALRARQRVERFPKLLHHGSCRLVHLEHCLKQIGQRMTKDEWFLARRAKSHCSIATCDFARRSQGPLRRVKRTDCFQAVLYKPRCSGCLNAETCDQLGRGHRGLALGKLHLGRVDACAIEDASDLLVREPHPLAHEVSRWPAVALTG